ncbi:aggrecan core protein-like protein [Leptotrombidium deliense]|uniref:Aggrecan core protein-like protein n=1 Tax=Leptotrombidium deliense TaxID=299467 RepID=A0A443SFF8_9ACAR|nr:aggrecan core protein-like protein [Leptotrombidium deliense]
MKFILLASIFFFHVLRSISARCPDEWTAFNGNCYIVTKFTDFVSGQNYCKTMNATLPSVHSKEENEFLALLLRVNNVYNFWLNACQVERGNSKFQWLDGSKFNYQNWSKNEPDEIISSETVCIKLNKDGEWGDERMSRFNMIACVKKRKDSVIIEINPNDIMENSLKPNSDFDSKFRNISEKLQDFKKDMNYLELKVKVQKAFILLMSQIREKYSLQTTVSQLQNETKNELLNLKNKTNTLLEMIIAVNSEVSKLKKSLIKK